MKKEEKLSELNKVNNLLKQRVKHYQSIQHGNRREYKSYKENGSDDCTLMAIGQKIYETKAVLKALERQCIEVKKKIRVLNRLQNSIRNV